MNKKGWLRVVEALFAIMLVMGVVMVIATKNKPQTNLSEEIYKKQRIIIETISKNQSIRNATIEGRKDVIDDSIKGMIPTSWGFATRICDIREICNTDTPNDRDIYSTEVIISSTLEEYKPKKLKFFVWIRNANDKILPKPHFEISSPVIENNIIPPTHTCVFPNSPSIPLKIGNIPSNTKSLAISIVDETDLNEKAHLIAWNIPPDITDIIVEDIPSYGGVIGVNFEGLNSYSPVCSPPSETHIYAFKVYALNDKLKDWDGRDLLASSELTQFNYNITTLNLIEHANFVATFTSP
ncbi:MAG: YbhB/YbcL family Raf kinase inhibitor-like protein [Candidatus Pacearchaeota archaeon]|jgi:phosphatidylethanolamine-binding protein (PEBP) family uncharacterized protein